MMMMHLNDRDASLILSRFDCCPLGILKLEETRDSLLD